MAGLRSRAQTKKASNASVQKEEKSADDGHDTPTPFVLSRKRLLDLPPELRIQIYSYAMSRDSPIEVMCEHHCRHRRCGFTMIPSLTFVNKQLRHETLGLFLRENEFKLTGPFKQQEKPRPLVALQMMHQRVGLELQILHICHRVKKNVLGTNHIFQCDAKLTLSKVEGRVDVTREEYIGVTMSRGFAGTQYNINVCGCRIQRFARKFNEESGPHDIVPFFQGLQEDLSRLNPKTPINGAVYVGHFCRCPGPSGSIFGSIEF